MGKKYKLKTCPLCKSYNKIGVVIGKVGLWSCGCGWTGKHPTETEVTEDEYLKFAEDLE